MLRNVLKGMTPAQRSHPDSIESSSSRVQLYYNFRVATSIRASQR